MNLPLIYLTGMPRSGTSWIGKIFDSHPDTIYRHEPDSKGQLNAIPFAPDMEHRGAYRELLENFLQTMPTINSAKVSASLPVFNKNYYSPLQFLLRRLSVFGAKASARAIGECPVLDFSRHLPGSSARLVWKSIESTARIGLVARAEMPVHAIHLMRHPCGYIASVLNGQSAKQFSESDKSSEDFRLLEMLADTPQARRHGITMKTIRELSPVERLAWRWVIINEKALDDSTDLENCLTVRYESCCENPVGMARQLFAFCKLGWHPQTEEFIQNSISHTRKAYYSVVKNPLEAAYKWREQLKSHTISTITRSIEDTKAWQFYAEQKVMAA